MARPKTYIETPEERKERLRAYQREWSRRNPDRVRRYSQTAGKKHRAKKRAWFAELKAAPCMDCGMSYPPAVMDFHHRPNEVKELNLCSQSWSRSKEVVLREVAKCDLLCANCHRLRHNA